jgi:hypothetical protein
MWQARYLNASDVLGAHHIRVQLEIEGQGPDGTTEEVLLEDLLVDKAGNYLVQRKAHESDPPWELLCIGSQYFVTHPGGRIESLQPGMLGETTRQRVAEAWRSALDAFLADLVMTPADPSEMTTEGRAVKVFQLALRKQSAKAQVGDTSKKVPQDLEGLVALDAESGFPLSVTFTGSYSQQGGGEEPVVITIKKFFFQITEFGKVPALEAPVMETDEGKTESP